MDKKKLKTILSIVFILIMVVSFSYLIINIITPKDDYDDYFDESPEEIVTKEEDHVDTQVEEDNSIKVAPDVDLALERLNHNNNDIIGRLETPNLFNILIVKGADNDYYLHNSIDKRQDPRGSEFLDYRLTPTSQHINIYGHNSIDKSVGIPFIKLERFLDRNFFDNNPYIIFQYDGGKNIYKILAIKEITDDFEHMNFNVPKENFVEHIDNLKKNSLYTRDLEYDENSQIIVLQTCADRDNTYYIITGIKIN